MDQKKDSKKLIRLSTYDTKAEFDAQFEDEMYVPENSEIALHGMSFTRTSPLLRLNGQNNKLTFQAQANFDGKQVHSVELDDGVYGQDNIQSFFQQISNKLNSKSLLTNGKEFGLQYYVGENSSNKFEIRAIQNPTFLKACNPPADDFSTEYIAFRGVEAVNIQYPGDLPQPLRRTTGIGGGATPSNPNDAIAYSTIPFTRGCGVFRVRIGLLSSTATVGAFEIGLADNLMALENGTLQNIPNDGVNSVFAAIQCITETLPYKMRGPGDAAFEVVPTSLTPGVRNRTAADPAGAGGATPLEDHDVLEIKLEADEIILAIHTTGGYEIFKKIPYPRDGSLTDDGAGKRLYPYLSIFNSIDKIQVSDWECNFDQSYTGGYYPIDGGFSRKSHQQLINETKKNLVATHVTVLSPLLTPSIWKLETDSLTLSRFLGWGSSVFGSGYSLDGFGNAQLEQNPLVFYNTTSDGGRIQLFDDRKFGTGGGSLGVEGEKQLFLTLTSDIYLVEMLNIKLDSFDNFESKKGRSNLLAIVNANERNTGNIDDVLQYEPNNLTYISLANKQEMSLRNIRCRIVHSDYSPVSTDGMSNVVLHIRPKHKH